MNLSASQKLNLLKQLYELSTDAQILPFLDEGTTSRIDRLFQEMNKHQQSVQNHGPMKSSSSINLNRKKYNTEMQQINQINEQYQEKFANLFSSDDDCQNHILKEINVHLSQNILQRPDPKHNNFIKNSTTNLKSTKNSLSMLSRKQNVYSLAFTHQKLLIPKITDQVFTLNRRKSKEKLISYKVQTEPNQMNQTHGMSKNKLLKSKEKTPVKPILATNHSRSTLLSKSPIKTQLKRSQSQANKLIVNNLPGSLNSTAKHEKLPLLRQSESKSSLSTSKLKSGSKKSISVFETTATKKQVNSLPTIDIVQNHIKSKISTAEERITLVSQTKSRSKEKRQQSGIKKSKKKIHTQCSVQNFSKKDDFLEEMKQDENLNFDIDPQTKKKQENLNRRVVTEVFAQVEEYDQSFKKFQQDQKNLIQKAIENQNSIQDKKIPALIIQKQSQNSSPSYLQKIMNEINLQREQKLKQKVRLQRDITELKEKITLQKRLLQSTLTKNSKLQNEIQNLNSFHKSATNQRTLLERCINQTKKKVFSLKQSISKNHASHQKLISEELKEEQQLIEMYENVIDELKSEIKEQFKKKNEAKTALDLCSKKKENKSTKFNSTLLSTQKIKHDLTDAFKEWV